MKKDVERRKRLRSLTSPMSNSSHTPGSWEIVAEVNGKFTLSIGGKGDMHISYWPSPIPLEERMANIRLIASAPQLLKALIECVHALDIAQSYEGDVFGVHHNDLMDTLSDANFAIAAAKGDK